MMNTFKTDAKTNQNSFMIVQGDQYSWMVPVDGNSTNIFKVDFLDQTGMGGDLVRFNVETQNGAKSVAAIGPHHSNVEALRKDTGLDIVDYIQSSAA